MFNTIVSLIYSAIDFVWGFDIQLFSAFSLSLTSILLAFIVGGAVLRLLIKPVSGSSDKAKKR